MTVPGNSESRPGDIEELQQIQELTGVVEDLIAMMSSGNIGSLKLEYGSLSLSLQSRDRTGKSNRVSRTGTSDDTGAGPSAAPDISSTDHLVSAPMIGTFYVAPAPNEPPFVQPGDTIVEGQTIGIIEAMKIMNEIASDRTGTVLEVLAGDGQTVEYGSPLIRVEPDTE